MRHRKLTGKLGRTSTHRRAMFRNLVTSLLDHERVETTDAKARQVRRLADRMITLGKRGTLHARRRALRVVRSKQVTAKLFTDLAERYRERPGGYTRLVKLRRRVGDAAPLSIVELVEAVASAGGPSGRGRRGRAGGRAKAEQAEAAQPAAAQTGRGRRAKTAAAGQVEAEPAAPKRRRLLRSRSKATAATEEKPASSEASRRSKPRTSKASGRKKRS